MHWLLLAPKLNRGFKEHSRKYYSKNNKNQNGQDYHKAKFSDTAIFKDIVAFWIFFVFNELCIFLGLLLIFLFHNGVILISLARQCKIPTLTIRSYLFLKYNFDIFK